MPSYSKKKVRKLLKKLLTAGNCYIISMVAGSADAGPVLAGEEMEEVGGVAVYFIQEDCTITLTKTVRKESFHYRKKNRANSDDGFRLIKGNQVYTTK